MNEDLLLVAVANLIDDARRLCRRADELWSLAPVAALAPVMMLRNSLELRIADLEAVEL